MTQQPKSNRYSDKELFEFKSIIEKKLEKTLREIAALEEQRENLADSLNDNGYDTDDNFAYRDVEFLHSLIYRQKKHLRDLENALIRIRNKTYGICVVSGQLIDKRRLMAVPTTTKAMAAKLAPPPIPNHHNRTVDEKKTEDQTSSKQEKKAPRIITKIQRKPKAVTGKTIDNFNDLVNEPEEFEFEEPIDFDKLIDESDQEV